MVCTACCRNASKKNLIILDYIKAVKRKNLAAFFDIFI